MKKSRLLKWCSVAFALSLGVGVYALNGANTLSGMAEEQTPTCEIVGKTLSLKDNIYIRYAVDFQNLLETDETGVLVWETPQEVYEYSNASSVLNVSSGTVTNENTGISYPAYSYKELSAKQMTETVYATSYVKRDGEYYYGEVEKYSILQYAYKMLGYMEAEASTEDGLADLLNAMLNYGAAAQTYHKYNTDKLATDNFTYVRIENAYFEDGFDYGFFEVGDEVEFTISAGYQLSENLDCIAKTETGYILSVPSEKLSLKDFVIETPTYSQGLEFTYLSDSDSYEVSMGTCTDTYVIVPDTYDGKPVTKVKSSAFKNNSNLIGIDLPNTITSIGTYAFAYCSNLRDIAIPNLVTTIADSTFTRCVNLLNVTLPDSLFSIDANAFGNCQNLLNITSPASVTTINDKAFANCWKLVEIYNKSSVKIIRGYGFNGYIGHYAKAVYTNPYTSKVSVDENGYIAYDKKYLLGYWGTDEELIIPDGISHIHSHAFYSNKNLIKVTLPNSVTIIEDYAFSKISSLESISIPSSLIRIETSAFDNCTNLKSVYIDNIEAWCNIAFEENAGAYVAVRNGSNPLYYAPNLYLNNQLVTDLVIPDSVTRISDCAFYGYKGLKSVTIADSVTSIGAKAFSSCANLTSVTFENTEGWSAGGTSISSTDLQDSQKAVTYLTSTYSGYMWTQAVTE